MSADKNLSAETEAGLQPSQIDLEKINTLVVAGRLRQALAEAEHLASKFVFSAKIHNVVGVIYKRLAELENAISFYRQAIDLDPAFFEAYFNLGNSLRDLGQVSQAVGAYQESISLNASYAPALNNLANLMLQDHKADLAIDYLKRALVAQPGYAEAYNNLGNAYLQKKQTEQAAAAYKQAINLSPNFVVAHNNLGCTLRELAKYNDAKVCFERAISLNQRYAQSHNNLGNVYKDLNQMQQALRCYQTAYKLNPDLIVALNNIGATYVELTEFVSAQKTYQRALELQPSNVETHFNLAHLFLIQGQWANGWREYEWRLQKQQLMISKPASSRWQGQCLQDRSILLVAEQGLGDCVQAVRYARQLHEFGARVVVETPPTLLGLFANCCFVDSVVSLGDILPVTDYHIPLMSLPGILTERFDQGASQASYLQADTVSMAFWQDRLSAVSGLRIGVAWQGNPDFELDRHRSLPVGYLKCLAAIPGVSLIALQKPVVGVDKPLLQNPLDYSYIYNLDENLERDRDYMDTAAIMKNLDLVISTCTSVVHVAGALGVPTWVLLAKSADWRWLLNRTDSPWYPSLRLFRQTTFGNWSGVLAEVVSAIDRLLSDHQ